MTRYEELRTGSPETQIRLLHRVIAATWAPTLFTVPGAAHESDSIPQSSAFTCYPHVLSWSNDFSSFPLLYFLLDLTMHLQNFYDKYVRVSALIPKVAKCTCSLIPTRLFHLCFWMISKKSHVSLHRSCCRHTLRWPPPPQCVIPLHNPLFFSVAGTCDLLLPNWKWKR